MGAYSTAIWLYNLSIIPVAFISLVVLFFTFLDLFVNWNQYKNRKRKKFFSKNLSNLPFVTVMIPSYNDPIAVRCAKKCLEFDYPKEKYEIFILDDSTDPYSKNIIESFAKKFPNRIKYFHRENREGFKPGALRDVMKYAKGEIIVIFDADWVPDKNVLRVLVEPFLHDPNLALVQAKQDFLNKNKNIVTRFASYLLMIHHNIILNLADKFNAVFFCGTGGALRKDYVERVGGWNTNSITEDADLSVRLLLAGYNTRYVPYPIKSEVPETVEAFVKQQMRWNFGLTRVFFDYWKEILKPRALSFKQRLITLYNTLINAAPLFVVLMTLLGALGWFIGTPNIVNVRDLVIFFLRFLVGAGYYVMALFALKKEETVKDLFYFILGSFSIGVLLAFFLTISFILAVLNMDFYWYRTKKFGRIVKG